MAAPSQSDLQQGVPASANITKRVAAPGGGELLVDANGGVYAIGGAQYQGSYLDDSYVGGQHRNAPRTFNDLILNPQGGYSLRATSGEVYDLAPEWQRRQQAALQAAPPPGPAPNSLYSDPAYLAFIRNSDLGIETTAESVRRKNSALQSALGLDVARTQNSGVQTREGIDRGYESRGVFRSGLRQQDNERQRNDESDTLTGLRSRTTEQVAQGHEQLAGAVADRMRQAGELGFSTAQQQDLESKNAELMKKYPLDYGVNS